MKALVVQLWSKLFMMLYFKNLQKDSMSQPMKSSHLSRLITRLLELHCEIISKLLNCTTSTSCTLSHFKEDLVPPHCHHLHEICSRRCNCLSISLYIQFINPLLSTRMLSNHQLSCKRTRMPMMGLLSLLEFFVIFYYSLVTMVLLQIRTQSLNNYAFPSLSPSLFQF